MKKIDHWQVDHYKAAIAFVRGKHRWMPVLMAKGHHALMGRQVPLPRRLVQPSHTKRTWQYQLQCAHQHADHTNCSTAITGAVVLGDHQQQTNMNSTGGAKSCAGPGTRDAVRT
jgi:hypothetical protein